MRPLAAAQKDLFTDLSASEESAEPAISEREAGNLKGEAVFTWGPTATNQPTSSTTSMAMLTGEQPWMSAPKQVVRATEQQVVSATEQAVSATQQGVSEGEQDAVSATESAVPGEEVVTIFAEMERPEAAGEEAAELAAVMEDEDQLIRVTEEEEEEGVAEASSSRYVP